MFDAVILAGGAARRLDGIDKPALDVGGRTLLERALAAVAAAGRTIVVGPHRETSRPVEWVREQPAGGGPVAAIAAAVPWVRADVTVVLAADLPAIGPAVPVLREALRRNAGDVACLVDSGGRDSGAHVNYLAAAWRTAALRTALDAIGATDGVSARRLVCAVAMIEVPDPSGWGRDCDTWEQVAAARTHAER